MKKCPYCAEEIQDEAVKCKHCGEFLNAPPPPAALQQDGPVLAGGKAGAQPWYTKNSAIITAFVCVGPLALPLVWMSPRFSRNMKILITAVTLVLTYFLTIALERSVRSLLEYYKDLNALMAPSP